MLLQDKKGLSVIIGYVLLVVVVIVMSSIVYQFIKTYIPRDIPKCPDEVSVFIKEAKYDCTAKTLEVTVRNTGLFSVAGYFIHATTSEEQELATLDLSDKVSSGGIKHGNSIIFTPLINYLTPGSSQETKFTDVGDISKIEIIPVRWQEEEGKTRFVSCGNAKVEEVLSCWEEPVACEPDCAGRECGPDPVCGETCPPNDCVGTYGEGYVCDGTGTCVLEEECIDTCGSLGYVCGDWIICGVPETCPPGCEEGYTCDALGQCESVCGDEFCVTGDDCSCLECEGLQDGCLMGQTCQSGVCSYCNKDSICDAEEDCSCSDCEGEQDGCLMGQVCQGGTCVLCNFDNICDAEEDCLCSDCEGKKDGCGEGLICEDGLCVDMPAIASCASYCYIMYSSDPLLSGCTVNCLGACAGEYCQNPSEYCTIGNSNACCCLP